MSATLPAVFAVSSVAFATTWVVAGSISVPRRQKGGGLHRRRLYRPLVGGAYIREGGAASGRAGGGSSLSRMPCQVCTRSPSSRSRWFITLASGNDVDPVPVLHPLLISTA